MSNELLITRLLLLWTTRTQALAQRLARSQAGEPITDEELNQLAAADDLSEARLDASIARAEAEGR